MANDNAIALQVQPGNIDVANALKAAAAIQQSQAEAAHERATVPLLGAQTNQLDIANQFTRQINQAQLDLYNGRTAPGGPANGNAPAAAPGGGAPAPNGLAIAAGGAAPTGGAGGADPTGSGGPNASIPSPTGGGLLANDITRFSYLAPDRAKAMADTWKTLDENARANWAYRLDFIGRASHAAAAFPAGSKQQAIVWNEYLKEGHDAHILDDASYSRLAGPPNQLAISSGIFMADTVKNMMEASGQTAGLKANAELPAKITALRSDLKTVGPEVSIFDPVAAGVPGAQAGLAGNLTSAAANAGAAMRNDGAPAAPGAGASGGSNDYAMRVAQLESGNNSQASNPNSSSAGPAGFIDKTWIDQAKKSLPAATTAGKTDAQILALRSDSAINQTVTNGYAATNKPQLEKAGIKNVGAPELYLAHHFGADGATKILQAPANTPIEDVVSKDAMDANPSLAGKTTGDVYSAIRSRFAGVAVPSAPEQGVSNASKEFNEVPAMPLPAQGPPQPGIIKQGLDPTFIAAKNEANEEYTKTTQANGVAANQVLGQLGTMKSLIDSGKLITNAAADIRGPISAWIYAATGDTAVAQKLTGIDPAAADTFNKDSTRLGYALARSLGSREAMQVIQSAIKANPSMLSTVEGNKQIIGLLAQGAKSDVDKLRYGDAWFQKNAATVGRMGFDSWWNENHPVAQYLSKVVPYQVPRLESGAPNPNDLQKGVTYEAKKGGVRVVGVWDGQKLQPPNE